MIRAKTNELKHIPWFAKAGAACSIVPISRFVGPNIFALKGGGYGCLFSLTGLDEEGLTDLELESRVRSIEGSLRGLPEGSCLYQYTRVISGFDLPRQSHYSNEVTETFANDRIKFLKATAGFRRIDIHWCLTIEPSQVKALGRSPVENTIETSRLLFFLQKTATLLEGHLASSIGLKLLSKDDAFQFFSYLFNLEEWAGQDQLRSDTGVDRQIVKNPIAWHSDHLQIGKRHVQMFSLKTTPEASRPCLFSNLLTLDCDSVLCTAWRVKSTSAARSEIDSQEKFISFFKVGVLQRVMSGRDTAVLDTGAGAKAANKNVDDLSEVIHALDKKGHGEFSLRLLLAARSPEQLREVTPVVHRVFVDARAQVVEETLGNLSAFYAMFPGNQKFNVFPMWLSEDHHARLSSVFAPHTGHPHSEDLDSEYLNIFETRTRTPFFQDVYVDGVRVMLIIGPTGTGKTTVLTTIREGAEASGYIVEGFAPTSKAAGQLREAGIDATTLQSFLARGQNGPSTDPANQHLYMLDESSLASTKQMRAFLGKLNPDDRVLVIGDTRQHQGVEAGRPFQQMQEAGMPTSQLDRIMRQKDPELLKAVQHLANNETLKGIAMLAEQGRVIEIPNAQDRVAAIARDYAANPENTIIVSPDNRSCQRINEAVRDELRKIGKLAGDGQTLRTLTHRSDMTGAERTWAARYNPGDVLLYIAGSRADGIERGSFATVQSVDARKNTLTVSLEGGSVVTYDPRRLKGVNVFREVEREFAAGDRIQFTGPNKDLSVANRDLGTVVSMEDGRIALRMDGKSARIIAFNPAEFHQFDHGYAVTSHSSQGLTAGRVLAHIDTDSSLNLINNRLAYVSISRASDDARIYTNNAESLGERLASTVTKTSAIDISKLHRLTDLGGVSSRSTPEVEFEGFGIAL
jgi:molybdopterin-guanine dinucleotide biosynthesis protein